MTMQTESVEHEAVVRKPLRVLLAEDSEDDEMLLVEALHKASYDVFLRRVQTASQMREALSAVRFDLVVSDYNMPEFDALSALRVLAASEQADLPFVIVSGSIGESLAVAALKAGASNYVMKDNRDALVTIIERELADAQVRRERREAVEALRDAVRARDEFLAIASHELKTPLSSLQLRVERLLRATRRPEAALPPEKMVAGLESIGRSSARLMELVDRLLDVTRVTSGRLALSVEELDLVSLVHTAVARVDELCRQVGSTVSVEAPVRLSGLWDRERLEMVFTNLLTNAAKYGDGKSIKVVVEEQGDKAVVQVIDRGIGIAADDQARIFERFERAVSVRSYGGFGVGLWLSRQIVEAHGGTIAVQSTRGQGAAFSVTLPRGGNDGL